MGKVIKFPTKAARDWASIESAMLTVLRQAGAEVDAVEHIMPRVRSFYTLCNRQFPVVIQLDQADQHAVEEHGLKAAIEAGLAQMATEVQHFTAELFLDRLQLEISLYYAQRPQGGGSQ